MSTVRTDLAIEICRDLEAHKTPLSGIECTEYQKGALRVERVEVKNEAGERLSGKPKGTYITADCGKLWQDPPDLMREKLYSLRAVLQEMLAPFGDKKAVMVAALGNEAITADAIGPICAEHLLVTRHLKQQKPRLFEGLGLAELSAVTPGVLGQTGIESADVICGVLSCVKADLLIVIDALASRSLSRLATTVQLSDSGIRPGSGVGNSRPALSKETVQIPVISIGVPTVVDAATLAADAIDSFSGKTVESDAIREAWQKNGLNFFVTPKETDQICHTMGIFLAHGINLALNPTLSYEDMQTLLGG